MDPRLHEIFERQRERAPVMARTTAAERRERLKRLRAAVVKRRPAIADAIHADLARPRAESELAEVHHVLQEIDYAIRRLPRWMRGRRGRTQLFLLGTSSRLRIEPRGVVLILAPWNYPVALVINPLVAAIAAGNCVVLKPSEKAPATAHLLASLVSETFDEREVALVEGGPETAEALLELPFNHIFFTGGTSVGRKVMMAAAKHLASVTLELGGKTPAIVDASANVRTAAQRIAWGKFFNAGQTCLAPDYVLVDAAVEMELLAELKTSIARFYGESEAERRASPDLGRIVDDQHFDRLVDLVERSAAAGARVEIGGEFDADTRYVAPTVLSGVTAEMPAMEDEIFGPVLPVLAYSDRAEAIAVVRRSGAPLGSYIFSRDERATEELLRGFPAGGTMVNNTLLHYLGSDLPFGGVGASGQGSYHGYHGFIAMSHVRPVVRQREPALARIFFPPYEGRLFRFAQRVVRWLE